MTQGRHRHLMNTGAAAAIAALALCVPASAAFGAALAEEPLSLRLSPSQYRQSIADIFGASISITGRFEPETRDDGLLAVGARKANITDTGLQRYDALARGVARQVVDERHRAVLMPCKPRAVSSSDDACARQFFSRVGRLLYRRPLSEQEIQASVSAAATATATLHDFYAGISAALAKMLISPNFLFRYNISERDPARAGRERLDAFSKASELSFFLWNTTPDDTLLTAAESGELATHKGLERQVNRLLSSPRVESAVRAFFADMLGFSDFETVSKDPAFFPRYTLRAKEDSQEQTLRTIVDHVLVRHADYRDLFTTPHTFLTRSLAALYNVPLVETTDNGQPQRWIPYTYALDDPRAGILAQASFEALYSPAGRTSPTGRGKALRERLLCQAVPPPPGNVDFKFVQDINSPTYKTTRARLTAHRTEQVCAGCHRITDPIGLALENFDSAGGYRITENGVTIDASGEFNNVKFDGPVSFMRAVRNDPAVTSCVAKRAFEFATGRAPPPKDAEWRQILQAFADSKYDLMGLVRRLALSDLTYTVPAAEIVTAAKN
jgi:hypothetical protein